MELDKIVQRLVIRDVMFDTPVSADQIQCHVTTYRDDIEIIHLLAALAWLVFVANRCGDDQILGGSPPYP